MKGIGLSLLLCGAYMMVMVGIFSHDSFQDSGFFAATAPTGESKGGIALQQQSSHEDDGFIEDGRGTEGGAAQEEISQGQMPRQLPPQEEALIRKLHTTPGGKYAFLSLEGQVSSPVVMEVFDISGTRILKRDGILQQGENSFVFNMQYVKDGIYIFRASTSGQQAIHKLVKQSPSI